MRQDSLKRLAVPTLVFLGFLVIAFNSEDVVRQFGFEAISQTQKVVDHGVKIGLWFSAAFFLSRLTNVVLWDGVVAHAAKRLNMRRTTLVEKLRKYGLQRAGDSA